MGKACKKPSYTQGRDSEKPWEPYYFCQREPRKGMSQNTLKPSNTFKAPTEIPERKRKFVSKLPVSRKVILVAGLMAISLSIFLLISMVSYFFTGEVDQSLVESNNGLKVREAGKEAENWAGLMGAWSANFLIFRGFGYSMLLVPFWLLDGGYQLIFKKRLIFIPNLNWKLFSLLVWTSTFFGVLSITFGAEAIFSSFSGAIGYEIASFLGEMIGLGSWLVVVLAGFGMAVFAFQFNPETVLGWFQTGNKEKKTKAKVEEEAHFDSSESENLSNFQNEKKKEEMEADEEILVDKEPDGILPHVNPEKIIVQSQSDIQIEIGAAESDKEISDTSSFENPLTAEQLQAKYGLFDPTLELSVYKFPPLDILQHHGNQDVEVNTEEIEFNKNKIIETLQHYNITISSIKATVGPTVTLFEIVPDAGIRIAKIKSLEDDIAMSLEALKIRIIAPIPGKGTIGIEVPTKNRLIVSTRSVMATEKFLRTDMDLPIVLGKTISNEVYVADLAKMPHLLMAGATGQGKSVGINVLLTSLLYRKHPSQLKLVLVDPKKVELALYSKLERHFLAALPDAEECIITDTKKVVSTLNSLCIEMDSRYDLLKDAGCRNIKEYNQKFIERRLNPENGHRFLPFIVLVIDELADLMMTAGKEVETPIARLAQLARAIGIHLIVATQRPSVNVITGIIKANFPARLSFKVTSKTDSRTILDQGGADQLVSGGDMLLSMGSDVTRIQCPYISTSEVESICDYIGAQRGYEMAYLLPEAQGEDSGSSLEFDPSELDPLLEEAARLIVGHQQGSTSLIQRKMKLGYNRAGRLIDQMESLGIVGPFEGSKARQVLVDEMGLESIFAGLK
jgi:S-DNA-T family DNA segregation ATPase FtsK/SpoIIIE